MKKILFLSFTLIFSIIGLFSQDKPEEPKKAEPAKAGGGDSIKKEAEKEREKNLDELKADIDNKVKEIEEIHQKLLDFDPSVKEEVFLEDATTSNYNSLEKVNIFKYTRISFDNLAIKKVKLVTQKIPSYNEHNYTHNILEFDPKDLESAVITVKTSESIDVSTVKDYFPNTKKKVFKIVYNNLHNTALNLTFQLRKHEKLKEEKERKRTNF
ncbi:MAG: hypothetical protein H7A25_10640 [Leptospiraceae bacterium]|nr:hypothetical protein [Leptospiraceae bacterium]